MHQLKLAGSGGRPARIAAACDDELEHALDIICARLATTKSSLISNLSRDYVGALMDSQNKPEDDSVASMAYRFYEHVKKSDADKHRSIYEFVVGLKYIIEIINDWWNGFWCGFSKISKKIAMPDIGKRTS